MDESLLMTPPPRNIFKESKSARKFNKGDLTARALQSKAVVTGTTAYDRTPSRMLGADPQMDAAADDATLAQAFARLDVDDSGFITKDQVLSYLNSLRDTLDLEWSDEAFARFAEFHVSAVSLQMHVEQNLYSYSDFSEVVTSLSNSDNEDFIGTRLFHRSDEATVALRQGMKLVWAKAGEILCMQGQQTDSLVVLYHGSATGVRQTNSGHQQLLVSLGPGQVFGFLEMIIEQPALLTLTMDADGTVLRIPLDLFQALLKVDHDLLWNVQYEILTEVQRIFQFINAASFPRQLPHSDSRGDLLSAGAAEAKGVRLHAGMTPQEIVAQVFKVHGLSEQELREFRLVLLGVGAPVYEKGSKAAAFWVLVEGQLDLPEQLFSSIDGARIIGETGLLTRQDRARDLKTLSKCTLLRISLQGLHCLVQKNIEVLWMLCRPQLGRVIGHLASVELGFEHRVLRSGKDLYLAGDPSESLYILINGRLRILDPTSGRTVDVSKPGESIGEDSLLTESPHSKSVYAVRDTELLVLNKAAFETLLKSQPEKHVKALFRSAKERSATFGSVKFGHKPSRVKTVAVLSTSEHIHVDHFTELLCLALGEGGQQSVRLVTGEMIRARFPALRKGDDARFSRGLSYYMTNQEENYDLLVCLADNSAKSAWTQWLLRQVDMILIVGYSDENPLPTLERDLQLYHGSKEKSPLAEMHLVLVHAPEQTMPQGTAEWLQHRPKLKSHHHIKVDRAVDFQRLARVITGQTVGVVLSGGGARGVAHLGVLRALMELGVPIDCVGGSSMGSQISGMVALDLGIAEMMQRLEEFYVRGYYRALFWDVSIFPYVALLTGEAFSNRLKRLLGRDSEIEDLWVPYFCVSANLTTRKAHVHRGGPLWAAVRASASLPLLLPPAMHPEGILMDGGLMNNLPVDVARAMNCDIVIAVDVSTPGSLPLMPYTTHISGWSVLLDKLTRGSTYPSAVEMLLYLSQIVDEGTRADREKEADVYIRPSVSGAGLLDWDPQTQLQLIQEGHSAAVSAFAKLKLENNATWQKCTGIVTYADHLMVEHKIRSRNPWVFIAGFLGFVLSVLAASQYWSLLRRWKRTLLGWLRSLWEPQSAL